MREKREQQRKSLPRVHSAAAMALAVSAVALASCPPPAAAQRVLGLDVSAWQGNLSQATWDGFRDQDRRFVFIRATRGGTTGEDHRQGGYPSGDNTFYTLSQRYDDPYYVQNINRATTAGMFAGTYHYGRHDVIASTTNSGGIANTGTDEANHMIQMAGAFMRPGYMLPVFDLEGPNNRTNNGLTQFTIDFSNRIHQVMGIRPAMYINGSYCTTIDGASASLRAQVVSAYPMLWVARYAYQSPNYNSPEVQTAHPKDTAAAFYGPWDDGGVTHPWHFWQYASTGRLTGYGSNLDFNVAQGGIELVKDKLIPALWMNDSSGDWTTLANWNSGQTPVAPISSPGQLTPVGTQTLPTPRLPGAAGTAVTDGLHDTVILDRPSANITVTHASGTTNIRKLFNRETLNITGGSLTINYIPSADSTPMSAQFSGPVTLSGAAALSVHTLLVDAAQNFNLNGGSLTLNNINLTRGTTPAKINIGGNVAFTPLNNAAASINNTGSGNSASVDLGGGTRTLTVDNGSAAIDLAVNVPFINGALTKAGLGTMQLTAASTYSGQTLVNAGILLLTASDNINNTSQVTTTMTGSAGGTVQLSNGISIGRPLAIGGAGLNGVSLTPPGSIGALDNLSGDNTWAGAITLNGTGSGGTDPQLNQISSTAGTLVLSGIIQNGIGASWGKTGDGDVVLTGPEANTYGHLTRISGGRLILEKDGALGDGGDPFGATGNTFQLAGSNSTIAFRAPGTPGFSYSTSEWINLEGNGAPGFGQVDNLGGDNTFAGHLGLAGPANVSTIGVADGSLNLTGGIWTRGASGARTLNKLGPGTLIISGDSSGMPTNIINNGQISNGTVNVNAGVLETRSPSATTSNLPGMTAWTVAGGATLRVGSGLLATQTVVVNAGGLLSMPAGGGSKTLRASTVIPSGQIDLADHKMIVDYSVVSPIGSWNGSAYGGLTKNIVDGRNGGAWDGNGIVTSMSDAQGASFKSTIGITEAALALSLGVGQTGTWRGQSVDASTVLIAYAYQGDANLSGAIDADDFFLIDTGYSAAATGFGRGDFNYDGRIDADDYFLINANFAQQFPQLAGAAPAEGVSSVPEPAGAVALGALAASLLRRRRTI